MRKIFFQYALVAACVVSLTACGGNSTSTSANGGFAQSFGMSADSFTVNEESFDSLAVSGMAASNKPAYSGTDSGSSDTQGNGTLETGVIDAEKLVYRGSVSVTTLDYDQSVNDFRDMVTDFGGFIESEQAGTNDYSYSRWTDADCWDYNYYATVRIPSAKFHEFFDGASALGDVVDTSTSVENISQRYSTTQTSLEIYQAKYDRYVELLRKAETVEDMVAIEGELTDIEVRLAEYKTALSTMDTDVAYSYVDVEIHQVRKESQTQSRDTFPQRLAETVADSFHGVLRFLERALFAVIMYWWYAAFAVIVFVIYRKLDKRFGFSEKRRKKREEKRNPNRAQKDDAAQDGNGKGDI